MEHLVRPAFIVLVIGMLVEYAAAALFLPAYYRTGLRLLSREFPTRSRTPHLDLARLLERAPRETFQIFRVSELSPGEYAFRWDPFYLPFIHCRLLLPVGEPRLLLEGRLAWWAAPFPIVFIASLVFHGAPPLLTWFVAIGLVLGAPVIWRYEFKRFTQVAIQAADARAA